MRWLVAMLLVGGCARLDLRELVPPSTLRAGAELPSAGSVGLWQARPGELPPPPAVEDGPLSMLPQQGLDLLGTVTSSFRAAETPRWLRAVQRDDALAQRVAASVLGFTPVALTGTAPRWALSDEARAMALGRAQGLRWVLVVRPAVGPDDERLPVPGRLALAAEVALLDPRAGETLARGYDRVSLRVPGPDEDAAARAARRGAGILGRRLGEALHLRVGLDEADDADD